MTNQPKFLNKDTNTQDNNTVYWFEIDEEVYGVCESNDTPVEVSYLDYEGYPLNIGDEEFCQLPHLLVVTDEMRG